MERTKPSKNNVTALILSILVIAVLVVASIYIKVQYFDQAVSNDTGCALEGEGLGGSAVGLPTKCCEGLTAKPVDTGGKLLAPGQTSHICTKE